MKSALILIILLFSLSVLGQVTDVKVLRIQNATTQFGSNIAKGTEVFDINANLLYVAKEAVLSTATLTSASASFVLINPADGDVSSTNEIQDLSRTGNTLSLTSDATPVDLSDLVNGAETDPVFTAHTVYNIANGTGLLKNNGTGTWTYDNTSYQPFITAGTTSQYWRGDKTWQTLNTAAVPESGNLYYTDARARTSLSLTTTGSSGAATYSSATGVFNVPNYTLAGLGGVPTSRTLTINGVAQDLSADRSWSVTANTPQALTIKFNTGTTEGTDLYTFNGSAAKTFDIKAGANTTITTGVGTATIGFNEQYSGTVTSFSSGNLSPLFTTSVATPTTTPALSFSLNTQTQKTFFAGPISGVNATPTFRAIEVTDIPTLNQNTTGQAGYVANSVTFNNGGTGAASGTTYNGSAARTISYNTIGAEPTISAGTASQYWRGDKTWQTLNTNAVTEGSNLYYTDARSRTAISLTTNGSSGAATYSSSTGVLNVPNYSLANTFSKTVTQTTHGFSTGDWIRLNGTTYTKAIANTHATADVIGVVTNVADANTFTYQYAGIVSGAYTAGQNYFLSTTTAGTIGSEPSYTAGQVRQFVGTGLTDGSLLIEIDIGLKIASAPVSGEPGSGTVTSVSGTGSVNGITLSGTVTSSGNLTLGGTLGSIANSQLTNSSITVNGNSVSLGGSTTVTANTTNSLTMNNSGTGDASGSTFNGSAAKTISYNSIGATPADLPATLGTDHTYLGTTIVGTAGENLVFGDFVYFKFSDLKWWKASASAYATARVRGVVVETINTNATGKILIEGEIRDDTWNWTAAEVWLSTTSGAGTSTQPSTTGNQIQFLGTALSADHMLFTPSQDIGEK